MSGYSIPLSAPRSTRSPVRRPRHDIAIVGGDDATIELTVYEDDAGLVPLDVSFCPVRLTLWEGSSGYPALDVAGHVVAGTLGRMDIPLPSGGTEDLEGRFRMSIDLTVDGASFELTSGYLHIARGRVPTFHEDIFVTESPLKIGTPTDSTAALLQLFNSGLDDRGVEFYAGDVRRAGIFLSNVAGQQVVRHRVYDAAGLNSASIMEASYAGALPVVNMQPLSGPTHFGGTEFRRVTVFPTGGDAASAGARTFDVKRVGNDDSAIPGGTGDWVTRLYWVLTGGTGAERGPRFNAYIATDSQAGAEPGETWGVLSSFHTRASIDSYAAVAGYTQMLRDGLPSGIGAGKVGVPMLGAVIEARDLTGQPTSIAGIARTLELDMVGNGLDDVGIGREVLPILLAKHNPAGPALEVRSIIGVYAGDADTKVSWFARPNIRYDQALLDGRGATELAGGHAVWLRTGQTIALDSAGPVNPIYPSLGGAAKTWMSSDGTTIDFTGTLRVVDRTMATTDLPTIRSKMNVTHTTGAGVGMDVRSHSYGSGGVGEFWTALFRAERNGAGATGGLVPLYAQGINYVSGGNAAARATWAGVLEVRDDSGADSQTGSLLQALEIDVVANGLDNRTPGTGRLGVTVVAWKGNAAGPDMFAKYAYTTFTTAGTKFHTAYNVAGAYVDAAFDCRQAIIDTGWALWTRDGQGIKLGNSPGPSITQGAAPPAGVQPEGSLYIRFAGAVGAHLYVSQGGGSWLAVPGV